MPPPVPGTDKQQPPQTVGWKLNHICFRIRDPERTTHFYRDILGMRTVFTVDCGSFSILYFGYPEVVGEHETGKEMLRKRHNREGLIEFIHIHVNSPTFRLGLFIFDSDGAGLTGIDYPECGFEWILSYGDYCSRL